MNGNTHCVSEIRTATTLAAHQDVQWPARYIRMKTAVELSLPEWRASMGAVHGVSQWQVHDGLPSGRRGSHHKGATRLAKRTAAMATPANATDAVGRWSATDVTPDISSFTSSTESKVSTAEIVTLASPNRSASTTSGDDVKFSLTFCSTDAEASAGITMAVLTTTLPGMVPMITTWRSGTPAASAMFSMYAACNTSVKSAGLASPERVTSTMMAFTSSVSITVTSAGVNPYPSAEETSCWKHGHQAS
mmetsp:Transcript_28744/g.80928  ORF Transcript_28744/g.80928 Transcript_28744/m.80928 type:complete len:248 (+) Transcript_28744:189-932(+)